MTQRVFSKWEKGMKRTLISLTYGRRSLVQSGNLTFPEFWLRMGIFVSVYLMNSRSELIPGPVVVLCYHGSKVLFVVRPVKEFSQWIRSVCPRDLKRQKCTLVFRYSLNSLTKYTSERYYSRGDIITVEPIQKLPDSLGHTGKLFDPRARRKV